MKERLCAGEILAAAGIPKEKIVRYQSDHNMEVIREHRNLLCRYRHAQSEALKEQRRQLACLDYIIAQVEGAYGA